MRTLRQVSCFLGWLLVSPWLLGEKITSTASAQEAPSSAGKAEIIEQAIRALGDRESMVRAKACRDLSEFGADAKSSVRALIEALRDPEEAVRGEAARTLAYIGPDARAALAELAGRLRDRDAWVRGNAAMALGSIGPAARPATAALIKNLDDGDVWVRRWTVSAVHEIGVEEATPALVKLLQDRDREVRRRAAAALGDLGKKQAKTVLPALADALRIESTRSGRHNRFRLGVSDEVHHALAGALVSFGARSAAELTVALESAGTDARWHALDVVARIGREARSATPLILEAIEEENANMRAQAVRALAAVAEPGLALPRLIEALKDESDRVRRAAAEGLAGYGDSAKPAVSVLIRTLKDDSGGSAGRAAALALRKIGKPAVAALVADLADNPRKDVMMLLGKMGPAAREAVPALVALTRDDDVGMRCAARLAMWRIDRAHECNRALFDNLRLDLKGPDEARVDVCAAVGEIGPEAKSMVPALLEALREQDSVAQDFVAEALGHIGAEARAAIPALVEALRPPNTSLAARAGEALKRIDPKAAAKAGVE